MDIYASTARAARCVKPHKSDAAIDSAPGIFDAATYPIIGEHFFGIEPFRPIGHVAAEIVADLRRQRQIEHIHRLGARAVSELLYEVAGDAQAVRRGPVGGAVCTSAISTVT